MTVVSSLILHPYFNGVQPVGILCGAGGRTRTDMRSEPRQILSLVRIPISPLRRLGHVIIEVESSTVKRYCAFISSTRRLFYEGAPHLLRWAGALNRAPVHLLLSCFRDEPNRSRRGTGEPVL